MYARLLTGEDSIGGWIGSEDGSIGEDDALLLREDALLSGEGDVSTSEELIGC